MRVLVVDDEPKYCEYLMHAIRRWGHEVRTAGDGATAIESGLQFRPEVLVTDWMLSHQIHGLHLSGVLMSIDPRLQTILITGFDSSELRRDAESGSVLRVLGKPFELSEMQAAINSAEQTAESRVASVPFGVVRFDHGGEIVHINDKAWSMFGETVSWRTVQVFVDLFHSIDKDRILAADGRWHALNPIASEPVNWWVNCRRLGDEYLCILVPDSEAILKHDTRVRLLIADAGPDPHEWPFEDQVLILESDFAVARLHAAQLESLGCTAYRVDRLDLAIRLLESNPKIGIAIVDLELPGEDSPTVLDRFRQARPELRIVGNDTCGDPATFRKLGLVRFLAKPWRVTVLIRVLETP